MSVHHPQELTPEEREAAPDHPQNKENTMSAKGRSWRLTFDEWLARWEASGDPRALAARSGGSTDEAEPVPTRDELLDLIVGYCEHLGYVPAALGSKTLLWVERLAGLPVRLSEEQSQALMLPSRLEGLADRLGGVGSDRTVGDAETEDRILLRDAAARLRAAGGSTTPEDAPKESAFVTAGLSRIGPNGPRRTEESVESISHIDGCHFYCWVLRFPDGRHEVTFDERTGSDLSLHGRFDAEGEQEACGRCRALRRGAKPRHEQRVIADYGPDTPAREGFLLTLVTVGEIDEAAS